MTSQVNVKKFGLDLLIDYEYEAGEPQTFLEPGSPEMINAYRVVHITKHGEEVDLTEMLTQLGKLEDFDEIVRSEVNS